MVVDELGVGPIDVGALGDGLPGVRVSDLAELLASDRAKSVRAVVIDGDLDPRCAELPALEVLHADTITSDAFVALGQSSAPLRAIRSKVRGTVGPRGFAALAEAPAFAKLSVVQLIDSGCGNATYAWFRGPRPAELRSLELPNRTLERRVDGFTSGGGYDLGAAGLRELEVLDLENQYLGMSVMSAVARRGLPRVRRLGLAGTQTTSYLRHIRQRHVPELVALDLHRVFLAVHELRHIGREFAPRLEQLRLFALGNEGAQQLANVKMAKLQELRLDCCELQSVDWLTTAKWSPTTLDLSWNHLDDHAIASLQSSSLQTLMLTHNPVSAEGVSTMLAGLPALKRLEVGLSDTELGRLRERYPSVVFA